MSWREVAQTAKRTVAAALILAGFYLMPLLIGALLGLD